MAAGRRLGQLRVWVACGGGAVHNGTVLETLEPTSSGEWGGAEGTKRLRKEGGGADGGQIDGWRNGRMRLQAGRNVFDK